MSMSSLRIAAAVAAILGCAHATAQEARPIKLDIPAQQLDKALNAWADQTGYQVLIPADDPVARERKAPKVAGTYTPESALKMLLASTDLNYRFVSERTVTIRATGDEQSSEHRSRDKENNSVPLAQAQSLPREREEAVDQSELPKTRAGDAGKTSIEDIAEIIVTGTHIPGTTPSAFPLITVTSSDIIRAGFTTIGDVMRSLPQNFSGGITPTGIVNNAPNNASNADNPSGASTPNLRGLGPSSTLTLVNGRRLAAGMPGGGGDITSLPVAAIDRVEIVTDSASAVYGSDAVAGVVNIILKSNFEGAQTAASFGDTSDGGAKQVGVSQLLGTGWGSGHVTLAYEYMSQDSIDAGERDFTSQALAPNSLIPQIRSNSGALTLRQDIGSRVRAFAEGFFVRRDSDSVATDTLFLPYSVSHPTTFQQYSGAVGAEARLGTSWTASLTATAADSDTDQLLNNFIPGTPGSTPSYSEEFHGRTRGAEVHASGPLVQLPTGEAHIAVGAGYRKEEFASSIGVGPSLVFTTADGDRNVRYAFGEISVPLVSEGERPALHSLDLTASARHERYSDFGGKTSPKVGLAYRPTDWLKFRASWGEGFRAPNLADRSAPEYLTLIDLSDSTSPTGSAQVLFRSGGNPGLTPETSKGWSVGSDLSFESVAGLRVSATYFHLIYSDRIRSIGDPYSSLSNPFDEFYLTRSPSPAEVQALVGQNQSGFLNQSSRPYDPATVAAILDTRLVNVARQRAEGADLSVDYTSLARTTVFFNAAVLSISEKTVPQADSQTLTGTVFNPPRFRGRGGVSQVFGAWTATATVNYLSSEANNLQTSQDHIASWTTVDASVSWSGPEQGHSLLAGSRLSITALNLLNNDPPNVILPIATRQGFNYDSMNVTPIGRFVTVQLMKHW